MHPQNLGKTLLENLRVDSEFPEFLEIQAVGFEKGDGIGDVLVGFLVKTLEIELPGAPDVAEIVEEGDTQLDEFEGIDVKAEILVAESVGSTSGRVAEKSGKLRVEGDDGEVGEKAIDGGDFLGKIVGPNGRESVGHLFDNKSIALCSDE